MSWSARTQPESRDAFQEKLATRVVGQLAAIAKRFGFKPLPVVVYAYAQDEMKIFCEFDTAYQKQRD